MMKRIIAAFLVLTVMLTAGIPAMAAMQLICDGEEFTYNGNTYFLSVNDVLVETPLVPIVMNNRALVPVREVFEATGAKVNYNSQEKRVYIEGNGIRMLMHINRNEVTVNGQQKNFPDGLTPKLIGKKGLGTKTMVPVRFISETLGYKVEVSGSIINIDTTKAPVAENKVPMYSNSDPVLNEIYCKDAENFTMLSIKSTAPINNISELIMATPGVIYVDVPGTVNGLPANTTVGKGAIATVRTGNHNGYTRIALDVVNLARYSMKLSADKRTIMITTSRDSNFVPVPEYVEEQKPAVNQNPQVNQAPTESIVVIDAGHGGSDGGAGNTLDGNYIKEKDINLSVATKVASILRENGIHVEMTRTGDTYPTLDERAEFANWLNASIFVSVHSNSVENAPNANGIEVFYATENNGDSYGLRSQELANSILNRLIANTGAKSRGVKTASHAVTRKSNMPASLVEIGFMTNETELRNLVDENYQYRLAVGIAEGIMNCLPGVTVPAGGLIVDTQPEVKPVEIDLGEKIF